MDTRSWLFLAFMMMLRVHAVAQTTFTTSGNWNTATNWVGSNIGDDISEDVFIDNSTVAFIPSGLNYTIGNLDLGNISGLTIDVGSTLNVGESGTPKSVNVNNNASITVAGTLIIWGDIIVNNNLSWNITGTVIVKGGVVLNNGASVSVSGSLTVEGNFEGNSDTSFTITGGGIIVIQGQVSVGTNSSLTGPPGSFIAGGCAEGAGSNWCTGGVLPVKLLYFKAVLEDNVVSLAWATEREETFDRFEIEKAYQNMQFYKIAEVPSAGYSNSIKEYSYFDQTPFNGVNYYRLKAIDLNGSHEYFNIEFVNYQDESKIEVYPNPVTAKVIHMSIPFTPSPLDNVSIRDINGRTIFTSGGNLSDSPEIKLPDDIHAGFYFLTYSSPTFKRSIKLLVTQ